MNTLPRDHAAVKSRQPRPPLARTQASVLLDLVRGLAALLVLVSHWRNYLFQDYAALPAHTLPIRAFYLLTSAGHQAVVIFFVLSGYLISGSVFRMVERGAWNWPTYLLHRLLRLWVVLLPGLLLCLLWDTLGLRSHAAPALYSGAFYNHMTPDIRAMLTPRIFADNLFFLQGIDGRPMLGSDGALWSLANEFWYYLLFPLGMIAAWKPARRMATTPARIVSAVLFFLIAWFVRGTLIAFPIWLSGTLLALLPPPKLNFSVRLTASMLYVPILYALAKSNLSLAQADYLLTAATFTLLYILLSATEPSHPSPAEQTSRELARFSYTLYVVHMPFLLLLTALAAHDTRWLPDPRHLLYALALLLFTLVYAYIVALFTEFHTDTWRRSIERRLRLTR